MPILLLAAGQSARMRGRDKLMERVEGRPLIRRQADIARAATSGPVIVAL
ncbi:NTP transferase domain-containing protein, partial [Pseudooceanicola lipolyticus]